MKKQFLDQWAIILGGSSGFGLAAVEKLAAHGMNIAALYRETSAAERSLKEKFSGIAAAANIIIDTYNVNALDPASRTSFLRQFAARTGRQHSVRLLLHSIARGNLKPLVGTPETGHISPADDDQSILTVDDIRFTTYAMSTSLLDWARLLLSEGHFQPDARIIGLTSEGAHKYWDGYAAVSIAKSTLESLVTYMAVELARYGLKTNLIQAGISDTPSLKKIPASEELLELATRRNPLGRTTRPEDVANVIYLLCMEEASWINGSIIPVDGGEHCR
ncbi:MAG TPA: SDR family oxidoreductase [Puia sp.]|jgi:NAD(P)-dependent dehydrogenase (short-subunit alcohol dehydrogenase family)|nr:SDR family oxidoreductase [Puia sp.]